MKLKLGIAGFGTLARNRIAPALEITKLFDVAAVHDPLAEVRRKASNIWPSATLCASEDEFFGQKLDGVYIATPNASHALLSVRCLERGWGVLVEKPMAAALDEALAMKEAASKSGRPAMVAYMSKFNAYNKKALEMIRSGEIGKAFSMWSSFGFMYEGAQGAKCGKASAKERAWRLDRRLSGYGVLSDLGVYPVTTAADIFGKPPYVSSAAAYPAGDAGNAMETAFGSLRFAGGGLLDFEVSFHREASCAYAVLGDEGLIHVEGTWYQSGSGALICVNKRGRRILDKLPERNPYEAELEAFHNALQGAPLPEGTSFEQGFSDMLALDAIARSADAQGQETTIPSIGN